MPLPHGSGCRVLGALLEAVLLCAAPSALFVHKARQGLHAKRVPHLLQSECRTCCSAYAWEHVAGTLTRGQPSSCRIRTLSRPATAADQQRCRRQLTSKGDRLCLLVSLSS